MVEINIQSYAAILESPFSVGLFIFKYDFLKIELHLNYILKYIFSYNNYKILSRIIQIFIVKALYALVCIFYVLVD